MILKSYLKPILEAGASVLLFKLGWELGMQLHRMLTERENAIDSTLFEAKFTGRQSIRCRNCVHSKTSCCNECAYTTLAWMVSVLDSAQETLEVCMYLITYPELAKALIRAKERGCEVKVITTREKEDTATMLLQIYRAGIDVRTLELPPSELMHMKFAIIDKKVILTGSVNYTNSGFSGNSEEFLKIEDPRIVNSVVKWFHFCWMDFTYTAEKLANIINTGHKIPIHLRKA